MSGIIGKLSFDPEETLARAAVDRMLDVSFHRRGERRAIVSAPGVVLGSAGEHDEQTAATPVGGHDRDTVRVVADSALTNADALRAQLRRLGHVFQGSSDGELIARAYEQWGAGAIARLRGPFACAVWDAPHRRLLLARDHLGIRSLYFALLPGRGLAFASELRALLQDPGVNREWCPEAVDAYLALGYVPAPLTGYRRISKLDPAHLAVGEGRRLRVEQYWDLPTIDVRTIAEERAAALHAWLQTAVRRHLSPSSSGGLLYSGSTPSTALLVSAPQALGPIVAVDVERDVPELTRSRDAARHLGRGAHVEHAVTDAPALVPALGAHLEEPFADPRALAQFAVCLAARQHMDHAVAAHGAAVLWGSGEARARSLWDGEHRRAVYTRSFAWQVREADPHARRRELSAARGSSDARDGAMYADVRTWLPDGILATTDRMRRATGLELRFPFLDCELVELAAATPGPLKYRGSAGMQPLRHLLMRRLPDRLLPAARPRPEHHLWLRPALASLVPSMLLAPRFDGRGIVSRPALVRLWEEHQRRKHDHGHRLWSLLMLEFWFRGYIDGAAAAEPLEYATRRVA